MNRISQHLPCECLDWGYEPRMGPLGRHHARCPKAETVISPGDGTEVLAGLLAAVAMWVVVLGLALMTGALLGR